PEHCFCAAVVVADQLGLADLAVAAVGELHAGALQQVRLRRLLLAQVVLDVDEQSLFGVRLVRTPEEGTPYGASDAAERTTDPHQRVVLAAALIQMVRDDDRQLVLL